HALALFYEAAVLDDRAAAHAAVLPFGLDAQLRELIGGRDERREGNAEPGLEPIFEHAFRVMLGVRLGIAVPHHQPADVLAKVVEPPGAGHAHDSRECGFHSASIVAKRSPGLDLSQPKRRRSDERCTGTTPTLRMRG